MARCLIVANQTLGGESLDRAVRARLAGDVDGFHVLVPVIPVEHETTAWFGGFSVGEEDTVERFREAIDERARRREAALDDARRRAHSRLDQMLERIRSHGGAAEGEVGAADPVAAVRAVLERDPAFDEIVVSTLPGGLSRWLKMDLPSRVARMTHLPVTTVEAER